MAYAGIMCYLNYYLHDINKKAVEQFFIHYKRNILCTAVGSIYKDALIKENKELIFPNPHPEDGIIHLMDAINYITFASERIRNFRRYASRSVFNRYLSLLERAETDQFCDVGDAYNVSQTLPCSKYYGGPKGQGLSAAVSMFSEYFTSLALMIEGMDLKNETTKNMLANDPRTTVISIFQKILLSYSNYCRSIYLSRGRPFNVCFLS